MSHKPACHLHAAPCRQVAALCPCATKETLRSGPLSLAGQPSRMERNLGCAAHRRTLPCRIQAEAGPVAIFYRGWLTGAGFTAWRSPTPSPRSYVVTIEVQLVITALIRNRDSLSRIGHQRLTPTQHYPLRILTISPQSVTIPHVSTLARVWFPALQTTVDRFYHCGYHMLPTSQYHIIGGKFLRLVSRGAVQCIAW